MNKIDLILAPIGITLIFYNRIYGVEWTEGSADDVPSYISMYLVDLEMGLTDIFMRFISSPGQNEPVWHLLAWFSGNILNFNLTYFIIFQYLISICGIFIAAYLISKNIYIYIIFSYFLLSITTFDSIAFIWRQQLAFIIFLSGIGIYYQYKYKKISFLLILASCLTHNSMVLFAMIFSQYIIFNFKLYIKILINILGVIVLLPLSIKIMESMGMDFIGSYFDGVAGNILGTYINVIFISVFIAVSLYKLRNDELNKLIALIILSINSIFIAFPAASGIYIRYLMFIYPLVAIYFTRLCFSNFKKNIIILAINVIFISGILRIFYQIYTNIGAARFLAYGGLLDPFMGIIESFVLFSKPIGIEGF